MFKATVFFLLITTCLLNNTVAVVPPPSETPAKIIVSGFTSTAVDIKIVKVGQELPKTYADRIVGNTSGFEWYVSEHYALKSQMDEGFSRMILEVSELALPHWEALTGLELPDQDTTRMLIVYANSAPEIVRAIQGDLGFTWNVNGGGVTWWGVWGAYNYPSGTLQYHKRDLIIHENLHMLQGAALRNTLGSEGFTYGGAQHVYDAQKKQLTVLVFDSAPINHWTDAGIAALQKELIPIQDMIAKQWDQGGEFGSVYSHFFWSDPDRWFKWCIWRDEYYRGQVNGTTNLKIMEDIFGSLDKLNEVWADWVKQRRIAFHHIDWGWEQEGNTLMAYGWPWDGRYWSQMDVQYAPNEQVEYDPLRMDYPADPIPPTVGPVKRGVAEPSVGYVADLSGGGWGGFGLGVNGRSMCMVIMSSDGRLVIEGKELPVPRKEFPIPDEMKAVGRQDGNKYGVTIQIKQKELAVTVRAGKSNDMQEMTVSVPVDEASRELMMTRHMSIVAKDGMFRVKPFIDDARKTDVDYTKPAPANKWRFPAMKELYGLYRAEWLLKDSTPPSLKGLKNTMLATVDKDPLSQNMATELYKWQIANVVRDIEAITNNNAGLALKSINFKMDEDINVSTITSITAPPENKRQDFFQWLGKKIKSFRFSR